VTGFFIFNLRRV